MTCLYPSWAVHWEEQLRGGGGGGRGGWSYLKPGWRQPTCISPGPCLGKAGKASLGKGMGGKREKGALGGRLWGARRVTPLQTPRAPPLLVQLPQLRLGFQLGPPSLVLGEGKALPEGGCGSGVQPSTPRTSLPRGTGWVASKPLTPGCWGGVCVPVYPKCRSTRLHRTLEHPKLWTHIQSPRSPKTPLPRVPQNPNIEPWGTSRQTDRPPPPPPPSFPSTSFAQFPQYGLSPFPCSPQFQLCPVLSFLPVSHAGGAQFVTHPPPAPQF